MNVSPRRPLFNRRPQSNIYRMFLWVMLLLGGVWILQQVNQGEIKPLFESTPIPTRTVDSYLQEAVANALHHAEASLISVILRQTPEGLVLLVEDDGCGFDRFFFIFGSSGCPGS